MLADSHLPAANVRSAVVPGPWGRIIAEPGHARETPLSQLGATLTEVSDQRSPGSAKSYRVGHKCGGMHQLVAPGRQPAGARPRHGPGVDGRAGYSAAPPA